MIPVRIILSPDNSMTYEVMAVEIQLPHGHKLDVWETEEDVVVIMNYPDGDATALESIMKE